MNKITEIALNDWHYICQSFLAEKQMIRTHRGVNPMRELKEDYLINALALVFDATLRASLYDFNIGNYTTKKLYEWLLN